MELSASDVLVYLRKRGVIVHHAASMPIVPGRASVVVYLERNLDQHEDARRAALMLPAVARVEFSGATPAIMFVIGRLRV